MSSKYILINTSILKEGMEFKFDLFIPSESKSEMYCIVKHGIAVTQEHITFINNAKTLYVEESDFKSYEKLYNYLQKANTSTAVKKPIRFEEKVNAIYKNAAAALTQIFNNPETIGNYETTKNIVNNIVDTILIENFNLKSLLTIAEQDYHTHTHSINVAIYALSLGSFIGIKGNALSELGEAALLHDIGKSKIDPSIVNKDGVLTDEEFEEIKKHPVLGYSIGLKIGIKSRDILQGIRHHHEKMDGSGYPFGIRDENIPLFARIISICEIFDALTTRRSYKEPMSTFDTLKLMKVEMGNHLDIKLLNKLILLFK